MTLSLRLIRPRAASIVAFVLLAACNPPATSNDGATVDVVGEVANDTVLDTAVDASPFDVPQDVAPDVPMQPDVLLADATDVMVMGDVSDVGPYPPGPYGNAQGNVLANLSWEGYVNPSGHVVSTMLPYAPTSMQAMRMLGRRYGLVHVAEFY